MHAKLRQEWQHACEAVWRLDTTEAGADQLNQELLAIAVLL